MNSFKILHSREMCLFANHGVIVVVLAELDFVEQLHFGDVSSQMAIASHPSQSEGGQRVNPLQIDGEEDEGVLGAAPAARRHPGLVRFVAPDHFVWILFVISLILICFWGFA